MKPLYKRPVHIPPLMKYAHEVDNGIPEQAVLDRLLPNINIKYHNVLKENISLVKALFANDLGPRVIQNVTNFLDTVLEVFDNQPSKSMPLKTLNSNFPERSTPAAVEKAIAKFREAFRVKLVTSGFMDEQEMMITLTVAICVANKHLDTHCKLQQLSNHEINEITAMLSKRLEVLKRWIERINSFRRSKQKTQSRIEDIINKVVCLYEHRMAYSIIISGIVATVASVKSQLEHAGNGILKELEGKLPTLCQARDLLRRRIDDAIRGVLSTATEEDVKAMHDSMELSRDNNTDILETLLAKLLGDSTQQIGLLRNKVNEGLDEAVKCVIGNPMLPKENAGSLLPDTSPRMSSVKMEMPSPMLSPDTSISSSPRRPYIKMETPSPITSPEHSPEKTSKGLPPPLVVSMLSPITSPENTLSPETISKGLPPPLVASTPKKCDRRTPSPAPHKPANPLVFQFTTSCIQIGTLDLDSKPIILKNEFENEFTPTQIGLTSKGLLLYGPQLKDSANQCLLVKTFSLDDYLIKGLNIPLLSNVIIRYRRQGKQKLFERKDQITFEVLLGFLLRKLKLSAEQQLQCKLTEAVIAVPYRLPSSQRVQVKDAARVAGFSEVHLLNDVSSAAHFLASNQATTGIPVQRNNLIALLSESMGYLDCALYAVERTSTSTHIKMATYTDRKVSSNMPGKFSQIKHLRSQTVSQVLDAALSQLRKPFYSRYPAEPTEVHFIGGADSNDNLWKSALKHAHSKGIGRYSATIQYSDQRAILMGAILLSKNLEGLGSCLDDQIGFQLWRCRAVRLGWVTVVPVTLPVQINIDGALMPGYGKQKNIEARLPQKEMGATFFTTGINNDEGASVGYLKILGTPCQPKANETKQFIPKLKINHEGIVTLESVDFITSTGPMMNAIGLRCSGGKRKRDHETYGIDRHVERECVPVTDKRIFWKTHNLSSWEIGMYSEQLVRMDKRCSWGISVSAKK